MTAQSQIGIGTTNPNSSSILDITANNRGILIPRVTLTGTLDASTITNGNVAGLLVYNTASVSDVTPGFYYWNTSIWERLGVDSGSENGWLTTGNVNTVNGINFIGTTDAQNLDVRTNNTITHRFTQLGQLEFINALNNVYVGRGAGQNITSGNFNSFIGYNSGTSSTSGVENTFVGANSGRRNTTGSFNTFTGVRSGFGNVQGSFNSFYGNSSGDGNTFGGFNSFYGDKSGLSNTEGSFNSFFGRGSGRDNREGRENCFFGLSSGLLNNSGSENSFFGLNSGRSNVSGNKNVYIGRDAGLNNVSGNNNVFIGATSGSFELGSNLLYIENSDASIPLIWGDFDADHIGINRIATTNTLEVGGNASKATPGDWLANSDARLKKNIHQLDSKSILQKMLTLQGVSYEWNDTRTGNPRPEGSQYGFTAQNIQEVFPSLVSEDALGYLQTPYGTYDAMIVETLRELHTMIVALQKENVGLQERIMFLETQLNSRNNK